MRTVSVLLRTVFVELLGQSYEDCCTYGDFGMKLN